MQVEARQMHHSGINADDLRLLPLSVYKFGNIHEMPSVNSKMQLSNLITKTNLNIIFFELVTSIINNLHTTFNQLENLHEIPNLNSILSLTPSILARMIFHFGKLQSLESRLFLTLFVCCSFTTTLY
jgi:hypothetical protein